jgi:hypothetical protein
LWRRVGRWRWASVCGPPVGRAIWAGEYMLRPLPEVDPTGQWSGSDGSGAGLVRVCAQGATGLQPSGKVGRQRVYRAVQRPDGGGVPESALVHVDGGCAEKIGVLACGGQRPAPARLTGESGSQRVGPCGLAQFGVDGRQRFPVRLVPSWGQAQSCMLSPARRKTPTWILGAVVRRSSTVSSQCSRKQITTKCAGMLSVIRRP